MAQLGPILQKMGALRVAAKGKNLAKISSKRKAAPTTTPQAHTVTGKETRVSNPLEGRREDEKEAPPGNSVATTTGSQRGDKKKGKKKGKKAGESQGPPPTSTRLTQQGRGGTRPPPPEKSRSGPDGGRFRPPSHKEGTVANGRGNPPLNQEVIPPTKGTHPPRGPPRGQRKNSPLLSGEEPVRESGKENRGLRAQPPPPPLLSLARREGKELAARRAHSRSSPQQPLSPRRGKGGRAEESSPRQRR